MVTPCSDYIHKRDQTYNKIKPLIYKLIIIKKQKQNYMDKNN